MKQQGISYISVIQNPHGFEAIIFWANGIHGNPVQTVSALAMELQIIKWVMRYALRVSYRNLSQGQFERACKAEQEMTVMMSGIRALLNTIAAWGYNQADPTYNPFVPAPGSRVSWNAVAGTIKAYSVYGNAYVVFDNGHSFYVNPQNMKVITYTNQIPKF